MTTLSISQRVARDLDACRAQLRACESAFVTGDMSVPEQHAEFSDEQDHLALLLRKAYLSTVLWAELLHKPLMLKEVVRLWKPLGAKADRTDHAAHDPEVLYSEPLIFLDQVFATLIDFDKIDRYLSDDRARLESILNQTAHILRDRGVQPGSEADVRRAVYDVLKVVFPDTRQDVHIAKVPKTYKPDFGIPSLKTCIEYKFAADEGELKRDIDGVFTDMKGYSGNADWTNFVAVYYTAGPIMSAERLMATYKESGAESSWRPIIVPGPGGRPRREGAAAASKPPPPLGVPLEMIGVSVADVRSLQRFHTRALPHQRPGRCRRPLAAHVHLDS